jgi:hypothetical protein
VKAPARVVLLAFAALLVSASGLALGPLAAFCASPVSLWLALCALAVRDGVTADDPRRLIGAGLLTACLGVAFALAGAVAAGALIAALGAAVVVSAADLALQFDPPPPGVRVAPVPAPSKTAAVALDESVKLWWEITRAQPRRRDIQNVAAEVRAAADRSHERGWLDHPERFQLRPPPLEKAGIRTARVRGVGRVEHLTFPSEFEPQDPEIRNGYLAARANRTAHAFLWRHRGGLRPTLICVHGYAMGRIGFDVRGWELDWLHRSLGFDVAAVVLPLHGLRASGLRSGAGFLDGHPLSTNAALAQSVWDLRRLWGWLRAEGASSVGVIGVGVGGTIAAVLASVENGLACAIPVLPAVRLDQLVWRQMSPSRRAALRAAGLTEHLLATAWSLHSPLRMRPRVAHDDRFLVGAAVDRVVPPADVAALWEHWGRPGIHWSPGGHFARLDRKAARARFAAHLRATLWRSGDR